MKNKNKEKMKIFAFCRITLRESELEAESKSINKMREYKSLYKHKMAELKSIEDQSL